MAKEHRSTVDLVPIVYVLPEPVNAAAAGAIPIKRDGSALMVIRVFPVDFNMRSTREQEGILGAWAEMLDSLDEDCPIQIVCHNKKLDAERFLKQFQQRLRDQTLSPMRRKLIDDQIAHFYRLIIDNTMVQKEFYLVVPYRPVQTALLERAQDNIPLGIFFRRLGENSRNKQIAEPDPEMLDIVRFELDTRCGQIEYYLDKMGCEYYRLREDEIRALYYELFHPSLAERQKPIMPQRSRGMVPGVNIDNVQRRRREIRQGQPEQGQLPPPGGRRRKQLPPSSQNDNMDPPPSL
jgi:hypothetical protein